MKKYFVLSVFALVTGFAASALAGHQEGGVLPPPPPIQPYPDEVNVLSCNVFQYTLKCETDYYGREECRVTNNISKDPVKVDFQETETGTLRVRSTVNGHASLVYQSKGPMYCNPESYTCWSANQSEKISVVTTPSRAYGTNEFTIWEQRPVSRYAFIVGATAKIECKVGSEYQD